MITKREIENQIDFLSTIKNIMETYEEIAASRMQKIRNSVLQSRDFVFEINSIFQHVKYSYKSRVQKLMQQRKSKDLSKFNFNMRNCKTLYVLISANTGLYGQVIADTYEAFEERYRNQKAD